MARHLHYIIQGFDVMMPEGALTNSTQVDIIVLYGDEKAALPAAADGSKQTRQRSRAAASSGVQSLEAHALARAATLISKPNYRVANVIEHDTDLHPEEAHAH